MKRIFSLTLVAALAGCAGAARYTDPVAVTPREPLNVAFEISNGDPVAKPVHWDGQESLFIRGGKHNSLNLRQSTPESGLARVYVSVSFAPTPENSEVVAFTSKEGATSRVAVPPAPRMYYCPFPAVGAECRPKDEQGHDIFVVRRVL